LQRSEGLQKPLGAKDSCKELQIAVESFKELWEIFKEILSFKKLWESLRLRLNKRRTSSKGF
jgi:hypothetical protein